LKARYTRLTAAHLTSASPPGAKAPPLDWSSGSNGPSEAWEAADVETKAIIAHACAAEASFALSEMERLNAEALSALVSRNNVQLKSFSADLVAAAKREAAAVLGELGARSEIARRVHESYVGFRDRTAAWSRISIKGVLDARES